MSSWGTAEIVFDAQVMRHVQNALNEFESTGQAVTVHIPPEFTVTYSESTGLRELAVSSHSPITRNTLIHIASTFGFHDSPQQWTVISEGDAAYVIAKL